MQSARGRGTLKDTKFLRVSCEMLDGQVDWGEVPTSVDFILDEVVDLSVD